MFRNAKVGDRVWSMNRCWGKIVEINPNLACPLRVEFDKFDYLMSFTMEGREYVDDINPTLFWDEIKFEIPEKPFDLEKELRNLKVVEFTCGDHNYYLYWDYDFKTVDTDYGCGIELINYKYFSESSIKTFIDRIEGKNITKEEFFKAYDNVFGGK